jgi:glycosyltransferase involved in cell wall biosynthesis
MNIGIDIRVLLTPTRTGVAEYTFELLNALFAIDTTNQYWLFYNSYKNLSTHLPRWKQGTVHYVETKWPNKLLSASLWLRGKPLLDELIAQQHNSTTAQQQYNNITMEQLDFWFSPNLNFTALSPGTKHILTIHDLSFELFPEFYSWKRRWWHSMVKPREQCERAHLILTPSENTKRDIVALYGLHEDKIQVIKPGLTLLSDKKLGNKEIKKLEIKQKYQLPERFILFLGTIEPRKNIAGVIEAYRTYSREKKYPVSLVIAGPRGWKEGSILRMIQKTPGAQYIGYVDAEDKPALYAMAKIFIYPSLYEGFGFPILEAMSAGTPVVTSNRASLPEVAGSAAYLVDPYNVSEMARGLERLLSDAKLRDFFAKQGRERVKEFSWQNAAREFLTQLV